MNNQKTFKQDTLESQFQQFRGFAATSLRNMRRHKDSETLYHYFHGKYQAYKLAADSMKAYASILNGFKLSKKQITK